MYRLNEFNKKHQILLELETMKTKEALTLKAILYGLTDLWTSWQKYVNRTSWFGNVWRIEASTAFYTA